MGRGGGGGQEAPSVTEHGHTDMARSSCGGGSFPITPVFSAQCESGLLAQREGGVGRCLWCQDGVKG